MTECDLDTSVPDWVIEHPECLAIFVEFGIDYCCGGKSLAFACREQGLDQQVVLAAVRQRIECSSACPKGPESPISMPVQMLFPGS